MMGEDPEMQRGLLEKFLINADTQVQRVVQALADGDTATLGDVAHGLKSSSQMVGAIQRGAMSKALETAGVDLDAAACRVLTGELEAAFGFIGNEICGHLSAQA